jgi:hypothetical protein
MNCHLLVPDVFHVAAGGTGLYAGLELRALEALFARGKMQRLPGLSLERWLAATFRIAADPDLSLAALSLLGDGAAPGAACWLQADPVHLRVYRDQLLLAPPGAITAGEAGALTDALNAHFAEDGLEFSAPVPQRWYVRVRDEPRMRTTPTAEATGRNIDGLLPEGDDGPRWRHIINEAQMLLHEHPCNEARETRGELPVNSVWPWGAGRVPQVPRDAPYGVVWSVHPLAAGIASVTGLPLRILPQSGAQLPATPGDLGDDKPQLLVLDALHASLGGDPEEWRGALGKMETHWFAPLFDALKRGELSSLTLHALGPDRSCTVTATRLDALKFWRARRPLGHYAA